MRGLELSRAFYEEAVRPIVDRAFPRLEHAAALIGPGSEVLGYDDETSTDHHWGPRVQLFVGDLAPAQDVQRVLADELPTSFGGFPTNFGPRTRSARACSSRSTRGRWRTGSIASCSASSCASGSASTRWRGSPRPTGS